MVNSKAATLSGIFGVILGVAGLVDWNSVGHDPKRIGLALLVAVSTYIAGHGKSLSRPTEESILDDTITVRRRAQP